jgi:hypothetical protein
VVPLNIYLILTAAVMFFQLGLTVGMPWGAASMGGKFPGKYPAKMRWVALLNILILGLMAIVVLTKARQILPGFYHHSEKGIWVVVIFFGLGTLMNAITPSKIERIWMPVALIQTIAAWWIAVAEF